MGIIYQLESHVGRRSFSDREASDYSFYPEGLAMNFG